MITSFYVVHMVFNYVHIFNDEKGNNNTFTHKKGKKSIYYESNEELSLKGIIRTVLLF